MMIARGECNGGPFLLLGLSAENIKRLVDGKPIRISRETHGDGIPESWTIGIIYGETERQLVETVKPLMPFPSMIFKLPDPDL